MCGRYTITSIERAVAALFPELALPDDFLPRYNVAPTQEIWSVVHHRDKDQLETLRWGLVPFWAEDAKIGNKMINARAETLDKKPVFRELLKKRRCVILADGFYEWRKNKDGSKTPMYIQLKNREPFGFAGLWDRWKDPAGHEIHSCTIITTRANDLVRDIHDRMPVILPAGDVRQWLDEKTDPQNLLKPIPGSAMQATEVSPAVNSPNVDDAKCIEGMTSSSQKQKKHEEKGLFD